MPTEIQNPIRFRFLPRVFERSYRTRRALIFQISSVYICGLFAYETLLPILPRLQLWITVIAIGLLQSMLVFLANRRSLDPTIPGWEERPSRWERAVKILNLLLALALLVHFAAPMIHSLHL